MSSGRSRRCESFTRSADVDIYTAALDERLNEDVYRSWFGDAGDRLFEQNNNKNR